MKLKAWVDGQCEGPNFCIACVCMERKFGMRKSINKVIIYQRGIKPLVGQMDHFLGVHKMK